MHILVATIVHHPHDARIAHRQIPALLGAGHDVTYLAPWSAWDAEPLGGVVAVDVPRAAGRRRLGAVRAARRRIAALAPRCDLLIVHDPELVPVVWGRGQRRRVRVWDVHEDTAAALADKPWVPAILRPVARAALRVLERRAERRVRLLLAEEDYRPRFALDHPVVPNTPLVPATVPPPGPDRVVHVGRLSRLRGALELAALGGMLPAGVRLELFGPPDADVAAALAGTDPERVTRHGFVPNPQALAQVEGALAGLSLLRDEPNYRHSRPTKILEYMARGVPVITTPLPHAVELVERHRCGLVVPFEDAQAALDAINTLRDDPDERITMGARGHEAARQHYDWERAGPVFVRQLEDWAEESRDI